MPEKKKRFVDRIVADPFTVQFCALSIILLAFFILLNSMAVLDQEKVRLAIGSLIGTFGRRPGGGDSVSRPGMFSNPDIEVSGAEMGELADYLSDVIDREGLGGNVDVFRRDDDAVIRIEGRALFAEGSDELLPGAETVLSAVAVTIGESERPVVIEGHTDRHSTVGPVSRTPWMFAAARGARVHGALLSRGLAPERLSVASLGSTRPHMPNVTEWQRSLNRRIEIVIRGGARDPLFRPRSRVVDFDGYKVEVPLADPEGPRDERSGAEALES